MSTTQKNRAARRVFSSPEKARRAGVEILHAAPSVWDRVEKRGFEALRGAARALALDWWRTKQRAKAAVGWLVRNAAALACVVVLVALACSAVLFGAVILCFAIIALVVFLALRRSRK